MPKASPAISGESVASRTSTETASIRRLVAVMLTARERNSARNSGTASTSPYRARSTASAVMRDTLPGRPGHSPMFRAQPKPQA